METEKMKGGLKMEENKSETITIRKDRLWMYSTFVLVALVVVMAFVAFGGNNNSGVTGNVVQQPTGEQGQVAQVTADDDAFLGPEDAEIVIIEFSDFECPYCGAAMGTHSGLINQFKSQNPDWEAAVPKLKEVAEQGKIKFVYRDFPLSGHPNAQKSAEAAECAKNQGKFWEYHDVLFENQVALTVPSLKQYATDLKLDTKEFNECLDSGEKAAEVRKDFNDGQAAGVQGTPAFFVNGQLVSGAQPFSAFERFLV